MNRRTVIRRLSGLTFATSIAGCTGGGDSGGSDVKDSDGDGMIDSKDYAPSDPDVQEKSDVQSSSSGPDVQSSSSGQKEITEMAIYAETGKSGAGIKFKGQYHGPEGTHYVDTVGGGVDLPTSTESVDITAEIYGTQEYMAFGMGLWINDEYVVKKQEDAATMGSTLTIDVVISEVF